MIVKLLIEHHLEFLSLKGGWRGSSESARVKKIKLLEISCTGCLVFVEVVRLINACDQIPPWPRIFEIIFGA